MKHNYNFIPLDFQTKSGLQFLPKILMLLDKNKSMMVDDYTDANYEGLLNFVKSFTPWFIAITKNDEFLGFIYCTDWQGSETQKHSCEISACSEKKYFGSDTRNVLKLFTEYLYNNLGLVKIFARTYKENFNCVKILIDSGFKQEGFLKGSTLRNNELQDQFIFGRLNPIFVKNKSVKDKRDYRIKYNYNKKNRKEV